LKIKTLFSLFRFIEGLVIHFWYKTVIHLMILLFMFPTLAESLKVVALSFKNDISRLSCCV
jgi:hypothetical protein